MDVGFNKKLALEYILKIASLENISQRKLCEGLYDYGHFNRMCNGKEAINTDVLFECAIRLGISIEDLVKNSKSNEINRYNELIERKNCILAYQDYEKLKLFYNDLVILDSKDIYIKQLQFWIQGILEAVINKNYLYAIDLFIKALRLTKKDFKLENFVINVFTLTEMSILRNLAMCYSNIEEYSKSIKILEKIISNENINDKLYAECCYSLCKCYRMLEDYEKHYLIAKDGVDRCLKKLEIILLPYLYFELALAYKNLGKENHASETYNKCLEYFKMQNGSEECIKNLELDRIYYKII